MSDGGGANRGSGAHSTATISVAQTAPIRIHHLTETLCEDEAALSRSLPEAAERALRLCGGRTADAGEIERALADDVALSGTLVAVAGAGLFAPRAAVSGVRGVVLHLGLDGTRDAIVLGVLNRIASAVPGFEARAEALRRRALAAGLAGRLIAWALKIETGQDFLVGLIHDVGELVLLQRAAEEGILPRGVFEDPANGPPISQALDEDHSRVGAAVCRAWGLSPAVAEAAEFHHDRRARRRGRLPSQLAAAADVIAAHVTGTPTGTPVAEEDRQPIFAEVGLSPAAAATVIAEVEAALPAYVQLR